MDEIESFSERLKMLRTQRGFTKSALAKAVGVSITCVWNWEEGNTHPRPDALSKAAIALSTTKAYLERGVGPESQASSETSSGVTDTREPVAEIIRRAREEIAAAAGLAFEQVRVVLEYGA